MDKQHKFLRTKEDISKWLEEKDVYNYTLIEDLEYGYTVEVKGLVHLDDLGLLFIPVKFAAVSGDFYCSSNQLTSLEFCPTTVGGSFNCCNNKLTSLEYGPQIVGNDFLCYTNKLNTLRDCPKKVGRDFWCSNNFLLTLEYCPITVGGNFYCENNPALGEAQTIYDFVEILNIQAEILIKKEKSQIDNQLLASPTVSTIGGPTDKTLFKV